MDFESLDPQNACFRIDGVRFVHKRHVHKNVRKINQKENQHGAQNGALRNFIRHRFLMYF